MKVFNFLVSLISQGVGVASRIESFTSFLRTRLHKVPKSENGGKKADEK